MRIGMLGYESNNSWTPLIAKALNDKGHLIVQFGVNEVRNKLAPFEQDEYLKYKKLYPLSFAIKGHEQNIDILIVEQCFMYFFNDLRMPVIYYHTELNTPPTVGDSNGNGAPTHVAMKLPECSGWFRSMYRYWYERAVTHHFYLFPHAYPPHYMPDFKKDINVCLIGVPSSMFDRDRDWVWNRMTLNMTRIIRGYMNRQIGDFYNDEGEKPCHQLKYNELVARSNHMVLTAHDGVYLGRSTFEALASKTIPIIWIENDTAQRFIESLGLIHGKTCYFFRTLDQLENLCKNLVYNPKIAEAGLNLLLENHTPAHRANTILQVLDMTLDTYKIKEDVDPKAIFPIKKAKVMTK